MIDENVTDMTACLNDLPHEEGISRTLSPAMIVLGRNKVDCQRLKVMFGAYCEVYVGTTNTIAQRSVGAIALCPSNNERGYWFMSLESGRRTIHGYIWNELPIPDHVIRRVEELADDENAMNLDDDGCPIFEWELGEVVPDEEPEDDAVEPEEGPAEQDQHDTDTEDEEESDHSDDEAEEEEDPDDESVVR